MIRMTVIFIMSCGLLTCFAEEPSQLMLNGSAIDSAPVPHNGALLEEEMKVPQEAEQTATESLENQTREAKIIRIKELLPGLLPVLPIDPYMPSNFKVVSADKEPNLLKGIYWGVPTQVEAFLKKPSQNEEPFFKLQISNQVIQNGPGSFTGDKSLEKELNLKNNSNIKMRKASWGRYPVLIVETKSPDGIFLYNAWVGLNRPSGMTLEISLILPKGKESLGRSLRLWSSFLDNTKELPPDFSNNAFHEYTGKGYTLFSVDQARVKIFAQKRISDGKILLVVMPANDNTSFLYQGSDEGLSQSLSNEGKKIVKVQGELVYKTEETSLAVETSIVVYLREVEDFTIHYEVLKDNKRITVVLDNKLQ